ncbi:phosphotransferase [Glycomyces albidus]|uniref:Phosphotransferase n=1 Tax=Glycomyces albidus TaxID=2656774 RepID=A0A6L5G5E3_9ACTN|nr:phosphotransferase [Glycomyces albidus]MQM24866.1 phosphotransferase [Glycomyces albidus]
MELIASGRASSVFALDDRRVLRRCQWNVAQEARLMRHLARNAYPVPEVYEVAGGDMVMERLYGPTLAESIMTGRTAPESAAEILDGLLDRLRGVPVPDWLPTEARGVDFRADASPSVLHLDLHPENVVITGDGPVVIDWTNAAAGDHAVDRAVSWVILAEIDPEPLGPQADALEPLLDALREGLSEIALATALRFREADPHLSAAERERASARAARLTWP